MNSNNTNELFHDFVLSLLAVNHWDSEKAAQIDPGLSEKGFFDPNTILARSLETNAQLLGEAGYSRGNYMQKLLTNRIMSAAHSFVQSGVSQRIGYAVAANQRGQLSEILRVIEGVGPMVLENFMILQEVK